ncbi:hypothetical protein JW707_00775 [Candidatus Woesearchaeota archaeon]|nr:hypothetical protein [Candidatus Woesearchaeota archaeon]
MNKKEMTVYVKLDEYKDVIEIITLIKSRVKQARYVLGRISELKKQEDAEIETWVAELDSVEDRVDAIDRTLTEPEI